MDGVETLKCLMLAILHATAQITWTCSSDTIPRLGHAISATPSVRLLYLLARVKSLYVTRDNLNHKLEDNFVFG